MLLWSSKNFELMYKRGEKALKATKSNIKDKGLKFINLNFNIRTCTKNKESRVLRKEMRTGGEDDGRGWDERVN